MSVCCETHQDHSTRSAPALTVALAGNPNSGKTTIFNALTGLRQKVANYPGVTVEKKTGRCKLPDGRWTEVIDLPGTYSLISRSPDEQVAMEVLRGLREGTKTPDVVVVVVDASNLQRNLYLVSQLVELGRPMVIALNMMDVAERRGIHVSPQALQRELGVPVVPVVGHKRQGVEELKKAIGEARVAPMPDWPLPEVMKEQLVAVGQGLAVLDGRASGSASQPRADKQPVAPGATGNGSNNRSAEADPTKLDAPTAPRAWICRDDSGRKLDRYQAIAERLLIGDRAGDLAHVIGNEQVSSLVRAAAGRMEAVGVDPMQADIEAHYRWIERVAARSVANVDELAAMGAPADSVLEKDSAKARTLTDRLDAILIHKFWGFVVFGMVMGALFFSIFSLADPMMGAIEEAVTWLGAIVTANMWEGPLRALITDGIFAGVGGVIVFVPQIALLFLFLAILEDSGYLARAAFLMDRLLAKVGLHGKSFIPLLSSFACAIPGIMATRTIENRKDRLATILVAPFMSCSARLPVYTLLIGTFFAAAGALVQAGIMFSLYVLGIVAAAVTAWIFKRSLLKGPASAFILEMPTYKLPQWSQVLRQVWVNTSAFVTKAGTIIFALSVILWAMMYYGASPTELQRLRDSGADENVVAAHRLNHSIAGRLGHAMEPIIRPLGYDWKIGVGLVGSFAAREIFVSTMGIVYSVGSDDEETEPLSAAMKADAYADGMPVWSPLIAVSVLVWFVLAMQCMSTLAIVKRETGGWRWPVFMLVYMNGLAYVICLVIYQVGSRVVG
jgi:ferrous iron transport protein B